MKKIKFYLVLFILTFFLCADTLSAISFENGSLTSATLKAAVRYRAFGNGGNQQVYIGNGNVSVYNTLKVTWPDFSSPNTTHVSFSYNGSNTSTTVQQSPSDVTRTYTSGALGTLNYIEIQVVAPASGFSVTFQNVKINSSTYSGNTFSAPSPNTHYIKGIDLNSGFLIEGDIILSGDVNNAPGGDGAILEIRVGSYTPTDSEAPEVKDVKVTPDYAEVGTNLTLTATIDDSQKGNSNILSAEYSFDLTNWTTMDPVDLAYDSPIEDVTATLSGLDCGDYTIYVRGTDVLNNVSDTIAVDFILYELGSVSGIVDVNGNGVGGVTVKLLLLNGYPTVTDTTEIGTNQTPPDVDPGSYLFENVMPGQYIIEIVTPLGFVADDEMKDVAVPICDNDDTVNFSLTAVPIVNAARSKGYWKNQFDFYIRGKGNAQESLANLNSYIAAIGTHYIPHFTDIFEENYTPQYWSDVLSYGGPDMYKKARAQLAALVLNMASLKISQLEVVTADGMNVADVITHASTILSDASSTKQQQEVAKDICEAVCNQVMIAAGIVPDYNIVYKGIQNSTKGSLPTEYALFSNYPNPFNPSTIISYAIAKDGFVTLKVYDLLGREVATLVNEKQGQGIYSVNFNASQLSSGVYIYKLQANDFVSTKKMVLVR